MSASFTNIEWPEFMKSRNGKPETFSKRVQLLVGPSTMEKLKGIAESQGKSVNGLVNEIVEDHLWELAVASLKPKPCPFCGNEDIGICTCKPERDPVINDDGEIEIVEVDTWRCFCGKCGIAQEYLRHTPEEAVADWNDRIADGDE